MNDTPPLEPAERLRQLWHDGRPPDLSAFLAEVGSLSTADLAAVLRVDQRQRWQNGERVPAESYLERHPGVRADGEAVVDLIFNEFLLREQLGERPNAAEFLRRFPDCADVLGPQIELHRALAGESAGKTFSTITPGPAGISQLEPTISTTLPGTPPAASELPESFGRYRIVRVLGRGGMGTVYLAHDTQLDRPVALKVPRFADRADPPLLQRFYREARIAATFTHPSLCPVYDVGEIDGVHFLTMPYLSGESLSAWLRREGPLPEQTAAAFVAQVARALEVAHRAGVIHRDLKPANVMVTERREPVVMDFGLARSGLAGDVRMTASGVILGTPAYMPPEQVGGDAASVGPGCDIYSLGVMLYEMLTGRLPFQGAPHELLRQVLTRDPEPPSRHRPRLDPRLEAICLKALAKEPAARFASMAAFAEALEAYLRGDDTVITPAGAADRRVPSGSRRRLRWLVVAVVAALLAALGGAWIIVPLLRSRPGKVEAVPDLLQAGSHWTGSFRWLPAAPADQAHDLQVTITERDGDHFRGVYTTGNYRWLIAGTVGPGTIRWGFTRAVSGNDAEHLVGQGVVEGTYAGNAMAVTFRDPTDGSVAEMTLRWVGEKAD
jgi:hypothetical protein